MLGIYAIYEILTWDLNGSSKKEMIKIKNLMMSLNLHITITSVQMYHRTIPSQ